MSLLIKKQCCCGYTPKDIYQYSESGTYPRKHWYTGAYGSNHVAGIVGLSDGGCIIKTNQPTTNWRGSGGASANTWRLDDNADVVWYKTLNGAWGTVEGESFWLWTYNGADTTYSRYNSSGTVIDTHTLEDKLAIRISASGNTHWYLAIFQYWMFGHQYWGTKISKYVNKVQSWEMFTERTSSWLSDYGRLINDGTAAYVALPYWGTMKIIKRVNDGKTNWTWHRYVITNGDVGPANLVYFDGTLLSVNGGADDNWDQGDPADDANLFVINPSDGAVSHHDLLPPGEVCPECSRGEAVTDGSYAWVTDGYHVDGDGEGVLTMIRKINSSGVTSKRWLLESGYEWPNQIGRGGGRLWIATW